MSAARPTVPDLDWTLLRSFTAVVEARTLTGAAARLKTTQPSVGRHIRALETQVGETLFDRLPGELRPNGRALALYEHAARMQEAAIGLARTAAGAHQQTAGTVRITTGEAFGVFVLPALIAGLMAREPAVQIELVVSDAVENLLQREADIAVRLLRPAQSDIIARKLVDIELGLYAHERYLAQHGTPVSIAAAAARVGYDRIDRDLRALQAMGQPLKRQDFGFRCDSVLAQLAAIEAGIGVGAALVPIAERRPGLRRVLPQVRFALELWLCAHDDLRRSRTLRWVFDELGKALRRHFAPAATSGAGAP